MRNLIAIIAGICTFVGTPIQGQQKDRLVTYYSLSDALKNPNEVQYLHLQNEYNLTTLPAEIAKLKNLYILKIRGSSISHLPAQFAELTNLHNLEISNSKLKGFPRPIVLCKNLAYMNLRDNEINIVPREIGMLGQLVYLDLGGNHIDRLPNESGGLKNLQQLIMDHNKLTTLPSEIGDLSNLRNLILSANLIHCLPPEIGKLKRLSQLGLDRNNLVTLPSEIGDLSSLAVLLLNSNKLKALPNEIKNLTKLKRLRVAFNALTEFPSQILEIRGLYDVNLRGNPYAVSRSGGKTAERIIPLTVYGVVRPSVIEADEPVPLTIAVLNGLTSSIYLSTFSLESNDWNGETLNIDLVDVYRDENPVNQYYARPEVKPPANISGPKVIEIEAGETQYIHTNARKWKLKDGWQPGRYKITLRVNKLKADKFCTLSVLSSPIKLEIVQRKR
ncbi:MAG: leucine-rich repeat domain-containing protein [Planctomycetota bacterium]|jgi:Leucine-rich repeat (LRR) protein